MKIIWLIVGVVFAGLILGWWASRSITLPPRQQPLSRSETDRGSAPNSPPAPLLSETNSGRSNPRWARRLGAVAGNDSGTNWEDKIEAILAAEDEDDAGKAKEMLVLLPSLPLEGQVEVAQHLGHMLPDENYPALMPYITNSGTAEPLLDALLAGLVGRSDPIKLPLLLTIAEDEQHPKSDEALNYLEGFLGQNLGTNWQQWSATVDQRLQAQPDPDEMTSDPP